jgi:hypothetical protein
MNSNSFRESGTGPFAFLNSNQGLIVKKKNGKYLFENYQNPTRPLSVGLAGGAGA